MKQQIPPKENRYIPDGEVCMYKEVPFVEAGFDCRCIHALCDCTGVPSGLLALRYVAQHYCCTRPQASADMHIKDYKMYVVDYIVGAAILVPALSTYDAAEPTAKNRIGFKPTRRAGVALYFGRPGNAIICCCIVPVHALVVRQETQRRTETRTHCRLL